MNQPQELETEDVGRVASNAGLDIEKIVRDKIVWMLERRGTLHPNGFIYIKQSKAKDIVLGRDILANTMWDEEHANGV